MVLYSIITSSSVLCHPVVCPKILKTNEKSDATANYDDHFMKGKKKMDKVAL